MSKIIKQLNLCDIFRKFNNDVSGSQGYTWCNGQDKPKCRLDYMFINNTFDLEILGCTIRKAPKVNGNRCSDHRCIVIKISTMTNKRGKGYWKLNNSLLEDNTYVQKMNTLIDDFIAENNNNNGNKQIIWDLLKNRIKEFSQSYGIQKSKTRKQLTKYIENKLLDIDDRNHSEIKMNEEKYLENTIDEIYAKNAVGDQIRLGHGGFNLEKGIHLISYD